MLFPIHFVFSFNSLFSFLFPYSCLFPVACFLPLPPPSSCLGLLLTPPATTRQTLPTECYLPLSIQPVAQAPLPYLFSVPHLYLHFHPISPCKIPPTLPRHTLHKRSNSPTSPLRHFHPPIPPQPISLSPRYACVIVPLTPVTQALRPSHQNNLRRSRRYTPPSHNSIRQFSQQHPTLTHNQPLPPTRYRLPNQKKGRYTPPFSLQLHYVVSRTAPIRVSYLYTHRFRLYANYPNLPNSPTFIYIAPCMSLSALLPHHLTGNHLRT